MFGNARLRDPRLAAGMTRRIPLPTYDAVLEYTQTG